MSMQGTAWVGLFRRIPPSMHDCLIVMTTTGAEIVLQRLIRLDRDYLVALGRLSGSTDQPKVLVVPYDQMTYLSFGKKLSEEEMQGAIGKSGVAAAAAEPTAVEEPATEMDGEEIVDFPGETAPAAPPAASPEPAPAASAASAKNAPRVAPPSKSILLARLRERLANEIARQPGS
jgi:hypothetical protein